MTKQEVLKTLILSLLFAIMVEIYLTVKDIKSIVTDVKTEFLEEGKLLAKDGALYLKNEYSEDAKKLTKEVVDSTKSQIINILK